MRLCRSVRDSTVLVSSFGGAYRGLSCIDECHFIVQNAEQILSRGGRIELLADKTVNMASETAAILEEPKRSWGLIGRRRVR